MLKILGFTTGEGLLMHVHKILLLVTSIPGFRWLIALIKLRQIQCEKQFFFVLSDMF
jgi:hypothetical protein